MGTSSSKYSPHISTGGICSFVEDLKDMILVVIKAHRLCQDVQNRLPKTRVKEYET
jgi:hypothetical protein